MQFCSACGGRLVVQSIENDAKPRHVCQSCHRVQYEDPKVAACTIPVKNGKVLLMRRAINPERGRWVFPGGYMDRGETVEDAAVRETWEESNLKVRLQKLLNVYSYADSIVVVVVYIGEVVSGELIPGPECLEARWFAHEQIPWDELAFPSTREALEQCFAEMGVH